MRPATAPRAEPLRERMLVVDVPRAVFDDARVGDLPEYLRRGDVLVVNDAATIPASLSGTTERGDRVELRLAATHDEATWTAVLFGEGDFRARTEDRPPPPVLDVEARIDVGAGVSATIARVSPISPRLVDVRFSASGDALWRALYAAGRPVQYAYIQEPLALWDVQTPFATRPWAFEMPCAGRPLRWELVRSLEARGVTVARVTHAAGLSSTGDPAIDRALPFPERFDIPQATVLAVNRADRVVAVGTTVVRALEGCFAQHGRLVAGVGVTDLRVDERFAPQITGAVLTGMHAPGTSHYDLLSAFAPRALLDRAAAHADAAGYLEHELGDSTFVIAAPLRSAAGARARTSS